MDSEHHPQLAAPPINELPPIPTTDALQLRPENASLLTTNCSSHPHPRTKAPGQTRRAPRGTCFWTFRRAPSAIGPDRRWRLAPWKRRLSEFESVVNSTSARRGHRLRLAYSILCLPSPLDGPTLQRRPPTTRRIVAAAPSCRQQPRGSSGIALIDMSNERAGYLGPGTPLRSPSLAAEHAPVHLCSHPPEISSPP